jgi:PAS domain S-box-containing protein
MPPSVLAVPPVTPPSRIPGSRLVLWFGALMLLIAAINVVVVGRVQYSGLQASESERLDLLATVLEDHATRTVDVAALTLRSLADHLAASYPRAGGREPAQPVAPLLLQSMASLPALRGIAVIDLSGEVVGSTVPTEVGMRIDLDLLGPLPPAGADGLGNLVRGGGLTRLRADAGTLEGSGGIAFLPLIRRIEAGDRGLLLVGLLKPDAFSAYQQLTLRDERTAALLISYAGTLLATPPWVPIEPGTRLLQHPLFSDFSMQQRDHGQLEGQGARPGRQLSAYRVSRTRPLVVVVEHPVEALRARWWTTMSPLLMGRGYLALGMLALTAYVWRRLRIHERNEQDRAREREALGLRERELDELFKLVPELIFRCDPAGLVTFVNQRYTDFCGRPSAEALQRPLAELVMPASREAAAALFDPARGNAPRREQVLLEGAYGVVRRFEVTVVPLLDGERLHAYAGSAVDLTERLMLQEKLRGQVAYTSKLLELCPIPVSIVDRDNRYVSVNRAWEQFTRRTAAEVIGRPVGEHQNPQERALHLTHDAALLEHGGSCSYEAPYTLLDQSRRLLSIAKVAIPGADGLPVAVLNTFTDLTEFREAERAMAGARQAAEEVSRLKSEFIASASHELRTPLQAVLGFAEIGLAREARRERQIRLFDEIHSAGRSMLVMVNDLLDLAKIEAAQDRHGRPAHDLRESVDAVARELGPLLAQKDVELRTRLGQQTLPAHIEPGRCQQLLRNLLANAIKVSPRGGCIELVGGRTGGPDGGRVQLQVRDQGPGIPPAELERIFEPFVQSSLTQGQPGTGLGLAICRKIVAACGGELIASNLPDGGAGFAFSLPLAEPVDAQPVGASAAAPA